MSIELKRWTKLGLGAAILGMSGLAACGGEGGESGEAHEAGEVVIDRSVAEAGERGEGGEQGESGEHGEGGEAGESGEAGEAGEGGHAGELPLTNRLAFMMGHVEAGLALYRAGEPEMAAPHLLHPVSETHAAERKGIDALGFDGELFEAVSDALASGKAASEIEMQLLAAEANLDAVAKEAGGDTVEIIKFLMGTIIEEYSAGVSDGKIVEAGEFQDAYGFAVVASDRASSIEGDAGTRVRKELRALIGLWAEGPVPTASPASVSAVRAQVSTILLELP